MKVNFCAEQFKEIFSNWTPMYTYVMNSFHKLGYDVHVSPHLDIKGYKLPDFVKIGIVDDPNDIYVYNHRNVSTIKESNFILSKTKNLFLKPTGPTPSHFTIDDLGYAAASSITYNRPDFESIDPSHFFENDIRKIKEGKINKWSNTEKPEGLNINVPEDHVLVIGQTTADETVTGMSFGNHRNKLIQIVEKLISGSNHPIVVKLHPNLTDPNNLEYYNSAFKPSVDRWLSMGLTIFTGKESLHDILPKSKVAIVENSTSGIECLIHEVPVISYGYPEYHWVTKDMRHITWLNDYVNDTSWHNNELAKKWLTWYCTQYQCYDQQTADRRIRELLTN